MQVRVPSTGLTLWARLVATGAGDGAGFFYMPRVDEVLLAFAANDPTDAFVLGGLWNMRDRIPPIRSAPSRPASSRVALQPAGSRRSSSTI
ncbi:MAG: phage baseplate assembly protein V [Thermomicrobiales bacterium]